MLVAEGRQPDMVDGRVVRLIARKRTTRSTSISPRVKSPCGKDVPMASGLGEPSRGMLVLRRAMVEDALARLIVLVSRLLVAIRARGVVWLAHRNKGSVGSEAFCGRGGI